MNMRRAAVGGRDGSLNCPKRLGFYPQIGRICADFFGEKIRHERWGSHGGTGDTEEEIVN